MKLTGYGKRRCPGCGRFMSYHWGSGGYNLPEDYPGDEYWVCKCGVVVEI